MDKTEVQAWVRDALVETHRKHEALWRLQVGERAIVAQIFLQMSQTLPDRHWNLDSEYNREGFGDIKLLRDGSMGSGPKRGVPDLIVHHRGERGPEHNLLLLEFKLNDPELSRASVDASKVERWVDRFGYQHGAAVSIGHSRGSFDPYWLWYSAEDRMPVRETVLI
jgi:hypothetical protein